MQPIKEITVQELKALQTQNADFVLIDVREPHEYQAANIGATLIPLGTILNHVDKFNTGKQVVVHCRSGARSAQAIMALQNTFQLDNLYNLRGGIMAYAAEIDPSLKVM
jgi:rhodanese-related sulfurtransferase